MRSICVILSVLLLASLARARHLTSNPAASTKPAMAKPAVATAAAPSVAAALQASPDLSVLLAAVKAAGISIDADKSWTILAPTNEAFAMRIKKDLGVEPTALLKPENKDKLTKVLQYHVIPAGAVTSSQLKDNQTFATALSGAAPLTVRIKTKEGKTYVKFMGATNYAKVLVPDVKAGNSVVHVVDDVLLPAGIGATSKKESKKKMMQIAKPAAASADVASALASSADLSTLLAAVKAAGISIPADKSWTILAPTNEAFAMRIKKDLGVEPTALLKPENKDKLTKVLQYHVIPAGAVTSSQLKDNQTFATALSGAAPLTVRIKTKEGKTYVKFMGATNYAKVLVPDVKAGNSVVHVVSDVLLPAGIGNAGDDEMWGKKKTGEKGTKTTTAKAEKSGSAKPAMMKKP